MAELGDKLRWWFWVGGDGPGCRFFACTSARVETMKAECCFGGFLMRGHITTLPSINSDNFQPQNWTVWTRTLSTKQQWTIRELREKPHAMKVLNFAFVFLLCLSIIGITNAAAPQCRSQCIDAENTEMWCKVESAQPYDYREVCKAPEWAPARDGLYVSGCCPGCEGCSLE